MTSRAKDVQAALTHGPGRFHALLTFAVAADAAATRLALAALLRELEDEQLAEKPLKILVAVQLEVLGKSHPHYAALAAEPQLKSKAPAVLIQVAAETEDERTYARRLIRRVLGNTVTLAQYHESGRHTMSQEAFGYADGTAWAAGEAPRIEPGKSGARWLLFQRCAQKVREFHHDLTASQRDAAVGRPPLPQGDAAPLDGSHIQRAKAAAGGQVVRRSIGYATFDEEGLLFLASAPSTTPLVAVMKAFDAKDPLARFAELGEGGLYVVPPTSAWLAAGVQVPEPPAVRPSEEEAFYPRLPIVLYEMTPATQEFFLKVFHGNKDNFDEGAKLRADLKLTSKGMAKMLYGGRISRTSTLFALLQVLFSSDTSIEARRAALGGPAAGTVQRLLENLAAARAELERQKRQPDANVAALEQAHAEKFAPERQELARLLISSEGIAAQLGAISGKTTNEILTEVLLEDAETTAGLGAARRKELDEIVETCERAASEARVVNAVSGKYMTFLC